ncbi:MAG TPA: glycerophosphodiester phosphodiesterase [Acidimicrobiales bacterium]|nr:glycerophosphodiester phosphodiesterase [Acidimicrobiales bacterium]
MVNEVSDVSNVSRESVWLDRRMISYAHQGGAWESPSSTLFAITSALAAGATGIELDVHATADGELVVCHDATVDRTTAATGTIVSFTLAELRQLDFSYWFIPGADVSPGQPESEYPYRGRAPDDPDFGIATLRQVLEQFPGVVLNLDIKQTAPMVAPYEEALARLLAEFERTDDVIVASFLDPATDSFRRFAPLVPTSAGTMATAEFWRAAHDGAGGAIPDTPTVAYQVPERQGDLVVVDEAFVEAAHRTGKAVHVWTVNDPDAMERLVGLGVDGIISDRPTTLSGVLQAKGVAWDGRLD